MTNYNYFDDQTNDDNPPSNPHEDEILEEEIPPEEETLEEEVLDTVEESVAKDKPKALTEMPDSLFLVPLTRRPFFPGMAAPIVIEPGIYYEMLKTVANSPHKFMGLVLTKDENANVYKVGCNDLYRVGVVARILRIIPIEQGGAQVVLTMEKRFTIKKPIKSSKWLKAYVTYYEEKKKLSKELKAYSISIISTIKDLLKLNPLFKEELQIFLSHTDFTEPGRLADFAVALTTASREELQDVLETFDLNDRIDKALLLLKKEIDLSKLQRSINQKIEVSVSKTQRDFFLREQLKTIKKELGLEKEEKTCDMEKFNERLKIRKVPDEVAKVIQEETEKLNVLEPQSPEYALSRNYLDWLTVLPWGIYTQDSLDIVKAQKILNEDHYGLEDVKQRILEFIGVGKLSGGVKGSILCFVGPPGVGKTSIGKSVARALGRKFFRFSVGGMRDEAEIKGHRRTYIGAMPGKIVQALKSTESMNPVIMLDEIDKIGMSYHGDPASALLEVLDPEQNKDFLDHYLDVRCDLSHVLFITTANILDTIPEPLKDRMDILRLSGYIQEEKIHIATKYLIPRNRKEMGLKATDIKITNEALRAIIFGYARESGVRSLEAYIKKILRKVALQKAKKIEKKKRLAPITIQPKNLSTYLGKPIFTSDKYFAKTPIGVVMGLAWTSLGGATLYVEAIRVPAEKTEMKLTGQAGEVMKESSQIAWSYLGSVSGQFAPHIKFFEKTQVHLHIPEGATPKDGPSAGITMATAILSLLMDKPVLSDLAMTGELTLTGMILPIGGVKEKFIAARRSGAKVLIFPKGNQRDYEELPNYIKKGIKVHFVEKFEEVYHVAFSSK